MPIVFHKSFGKKDSDEYRGAEYITHLFESLNSEGSVLVISNLSLPGGEKVKDVDILVVGYLENYEVYPYQHVSCDCVNSLKVNSFCFTIELKRHRVSDITINELGELQVYYDHTRPPHNVVEQSMNQRDSLRNVLRRVKKIEPFVTNLIWLHEIKEDEIKYDKTGWNILFSNFNLNEMFSVAASYSKANLDKRDSSKCVLYSFPKDKLSSSLSEAFDLFLSSSKPDDNLSRQKFEYITNRKENVEVERNGKLNILKGRAGTGKTIQLVKFAYQEVVENHKRCLLLTYNHALVSDIKRLAVFCDFPDDADEKFSIQTINSYFMQLMSENGIESPYKDDRFLEDLYDSSLAKMGSMDQLASSEYWDYLLIDEAQDCKELEIAVWSKLFDESQIVIADGVDQFVRNIKNASWGNSFHTEQVSEKRLTKSKRQKRNIVSFVNSFANHTGINWHVDENEDLEGGTVIITKKYSSRLHSKLEDSLKSQKNTMYDMLFLVDSTMGSENYLPEVIDKMQNKFGIKVFNGTQYDNRTRYPISPEECRLYNYNSCRGIEGWTVICMNIDELVKEKRKHSAYVPFKEMESEDERQERILRDIYRWLLMPFTRAIDTLVITLHKPDSEIGRLLKELHEEKPDYVKWLCD